MTRTPHTSSLPPPTQIVLPTGMVGLSLGLHRYQSSNLEKILPIFICSSPLQLSPPGLDSLSESRLLYQVRRFLSTLVKFGADISVPVGAKVKMIIFDLVVSYSYSCWNSLSMCILSRLTKSPSNSFKNRYKMSPPSQSGLLCFHSCIHTFLCSGRRWGSK